MLAGQAAAARTDFQRAYDRASGLEFEDTKAFEASVLYNLGLLAKARGDRGTAVQRFEKARRLKPSAAVDKQLKALSVPAPAK